MTALLLLFFIADVCLGTVFIKPSQVWDALLGIDNRQTSKTMRYIITDLRLPRAIMAVLTGAGLAIAGLLMQTLFRNPLAGPFVLGISSGAGLGVALVIMGATALGISAISGIGIIAASVIGSIAVLLLIILMSLRIKDTMGLLIVGLMVGSLSSAVVGILSYFSSSDELKRYVFWSLGSLGNIDWSDLWIISLLFLVSIVLLLWIIKPLNALLLGESYALSLGINIKNTRWIIIIITSILAGSITAFAGPIAFIGLAVPHLSRLILPTVNHKILIPTAILLGATLLLFCDIVSQLPFSNYSLPINAVTSLLGAPLIIWLIMRKRNLHF
ncbi:iron complex transport system permease protein [Nonlabens dokdonensis]|uniref:ABC-type iron (III) transport system, permease component n=2 Tax=Nonlabens dokdonensis TaxID=328515 RepID=L7WGL6_NONDD|nr:ABC-type iron (III) transport system, permease component [Nonlabens dokdonensis DSW-6]PZX37142.1 iron complex transport system permease protein [Nonlabens dokdonensis]